MIAALVLLGLAVSHPAYPAHEISLQVRVSLKEGFKAPPRSRIASSPVLNDRSEIAVAIESVDGGDAALWLRGREGVAFTAPKGASIDALSLDEDGMALVSVAGGARQSEGLHLVPPRGEARRILALETEESGAAYRGPQWAGIGQVFFGVAGPRDGLRFELLAMGSPGERRVVLADARADPGSPYARLSTPAVNARGGFAARVELTAGGSEIRAWPSPDGPAVVVARSRDAEPASPFASFGNQVAYSSLGHLAFTARRAEGGEGVFLWKDGALTEVARAGGGELSAVAAFAPVVNARGTVAFRGLDSRGDDAIFVSGTGRLEVLARERDRVKSDRGWARIAQEHADIPAFCRGLAINDLDQVAFCAALVPEDNDQVEWGSGIFLASPL